MPRPVLLDRADDLAEVDAVLDRAVGGAAGLLVFTGPIGIGRTALLEEVARRGAARGMQVVRAAGSDEGPGLPPGTLDDLLAPSGRRPSPGRGHDREDTTGAPGAEPADRAAVAPVLLLVDDAARCDADPLRRLAALCHPRAGLRVAVVLTVLDGEAGHDGGTAALPAELTAAADAVRSLRPLSDEAIAASARAALGRDATPDLVEALSTATEGNPLYLSCVLEELAARPQGAVEPPASRVPGCAPTRLRDRLAHAVRRLPAAERRYLAAVAVVGETDEDTMPARLAGLDATDVALAGAVTRRMGLTGPDGHRLRHAVVGDALGVVQPSEQRRDLHLDAARMLRDAGAPSDRVASHLLAVGGSAPAWTVEALRDAAGSAAGRGEPWTAVRYLRHALLAGPEGPERAGVLVDLAGLERSYDTGLALRRIVQAVPLLGSVRERAAALCRVTPLALEGAAPPVIALLRGVAAELDRDGDTGDAEVRELALRVEARLHYVDKHTRAGLSAAAVRLDELEDLSAGLPVGTPGERELACVLLHSAAVGGHRPASRVAAACRAVLAREPASSEHVHSTVGMLVTCLCMADAVEDLPPWLSVAIEQARAERAPVAEAVLRAELAAVLVCSGRVTEAAEQVRSAVDLVDELSDDSLLPGTVLAPVLTAVPHGPGADRVLARYGATPSIPPGFGACLQMLRARVAAEAGDVETALEYCLDAGRRFDQAGWVATPVPWRPWAVEILAERGRRAEARELAGQELARARRWGAPAQLGRALRMLGQLGGTDRAAGLLDEATTVLRASADRSEVERATRALDAHRAEPGPGDLPPRPGTPAGPPRRHDTVGTPMPGRRPAPAVRAPAALTRSEERVATRASRGLTNQEIAADLAVSVRAVEKHLTGVYRKLGVPGRAALRRLRESGSDRIA
ncbi:LuxR C-terminal-related transcriptional regulator [Pseudonocardia sp. ICBG1293]|uniref:LuxR C-terminal-related transcriptional regulator n=1 Tax=Pseudonocardia sp. ICBG1293 TaxID=2844382 RepID=UPI001CCBEA0F|nr:helix-turn-helix transcriptional regulator [Pseudonocardia sp. ICBG1293]